MHFHAEREESMYLYIHGSMSHLKAKQGRVSRFCHRVRGLIWQTFVSLAIAPFCSNGLVYTMAGAADTVLIDPCWSIVKAVLLLQGPHKSHLAVHGEGLLLALCWFCSNGLWDGHASGVVPLMLPHQS